jgi:hypothetical protein
MGRHLSQFDWKVVGGRELKAQGSKLKVKLPAHPSEGGAGLQGHLAVKKKVEREE